jgi:aminoglycoside phosphotransferase (APT) family kinase protein
MGHPPAEILVDTELVRSLLAEQHPDLAELGIEPLASGWDNAMFRVGDELVVRLPRRALAAPLLERELRWLPALPALPLPVPTPVRAGRPAGGFPWSWSIVPWIPGANAETEPPADANRTAEVLGRFLSHLHRPSPADAPVNVLRGVPLRDRASEVPVAFDGISGIDASIHVPSLRRVWDVALGADDWTGPPVWLHGDVHPLNLVVHRGRLSGVIDFGDMNGGDPASDLAVAWMLFPPAPRQVFRRSLGDHVDDETWHRARGWAVALGIALAHGDDQVRGIGLRTLHSVLDESG